MFVPRCNIILIFIKQRLRKRITGWRRTCNVKVDVIHVVLVVFRCHLTMIDTFVLRSYILNDQTPLVRSLVVVDTQSWVWSERIQANRKWMRGTLATPRHLHRRYTITVNKTVILHNVLPSNSMLLLLTTNEKVNKNVKCTCLLFSNSFCN